MKSDCIFCAIGQGDDLPSTPIKYRDATFTLVPLKPVVPGHLLIIPLRHVEDFTEDPEISAIVMRAAAFEARELGPCNLITSKGVEATQSVFHLHAHLIPRRENDGLALPWHSGKRRS